MEWGYINAFLQNNSTIFIIGLPILFMGILYRKRIWERLKFLYTRIIPESYFYYMMWEKGKIEPYIHLEPTKNKSGFKYQDKEFRPTKFYRYKGLPLSVHHFDMVTSMDFDDPDIINSESDQYNQLLKSDLANLFSFVGKENIMFVLMIGCIVGIAVLIYFNYQNHETLKKILEIVSKIPLPKEVTS